MNISDTMELMNHTGHNMMTTTMSMLMNVTMDHAMHHNMTHGNMTHGNMTHGNMTHGGHGTTTMDHAGHGGHGTTTMDHAGHGGHGTTTMDHAGHGGHGTTMDHSDHSGHDATSMDHGTAHTMKMYFHEGENEFILFESLHVSTVGGMVGACFAMFALAVAYEGLKYFREYLLRRITNPSQAYSPSAMNGGDAIAYKQPEVGSRMLSGSHGLQTILHMVQVFVSYCLMLVFMTYNVWLCLSIVLGAGVGYFLFGWRRAMVVDLNEHCH